MIWAFLIVCAVCFTTLVVVKLLSNYDLEMRRMDVEKEDTKCSCK